jgi:antitoxin (DNA-binding transcriptional repressor) of toxin-antitoxin stability system
MFPSSFLDSECAIDSYAEILNRHTPVLLSTVKSSLTHKLATKLSRYLAALVPGELQLLCNRNWPVAELGKLRTKEVGQPRIGTARGEFEIPDSFFEPLPDEILKAFRGN